MLSILLGGISRRVRITLYALVGIVIVLFMWPRVSPSRAHPSWLHRNDFNVLPHVPPKLWQIYLSFNPRIVGPEVMTWISGSPSYAYTILDYRGALVIIGNLASGHPELQQRVIYSWNGMSRNVLRSDLMRYLILALEGGVYSDVDTILVRALYEWVPDEYRNQTRLIVGIEADQSPPVPATTYEVQFCQWTMAAAPGHKVLWTMVESILGKMEQRLAEAPDGAIEWTNKEILDTTGPAGWTEVIYDHIAELTGTPITWRNFTGMRAPRLYGDVLVLPIDGFATGVRHSGASRSDSKQTMVRHNFKGFWKNGEEADE